MTDNGNNNLFDKPFRITIKRESKGYVRWQVHADDVDTAFKDWDKIKEMLQDRNEMIEGIDADVEESA